MLLGIFLDKFQVLSEQDQLTAVYAAGTFVARRWQEVGLSLQWGEKLR